jgi:hypothetical protein
LTERLPSLFLFDHAVVKAVIDGKPIWIDATASNQGGNLQTQVPASFGAALVLDPETRDLETMPQPTLVEPHENTVTAIRLKETGPATFAVKTVFRGENADAQRAILARTPRSQLVQGSLAFYSTSYPGIQESAPLNIVDDRAANIIRITEQYTIPSLRPEGTPWFTAGSISSFLEDPQVRLRQGPLVVKHPIWVHDQVQVYYPVSIHVESQSTTIEDDTMHFSSSSDSAGNVLVVNREYRSRSDFVPSNDIDAHLVRLERARALLTSNVPSIPDKPSKVAVEPVRMGRSQWMIAGVVGGVVVSGTFLALWLPGRRRRAFLKVSRANATSGEQPGHPIPARDTAVAMQFVSKWRCSCGQKLVNGVDEVRFSQVRYGGATLHVLHVTCHQCAHATRRYFALAIPPAEGGSEA